MDCINIADVLLFNTWLLAYRIIHVLILVLFQFNFPSGARITVTSNTTLQVLSHSYIDIPSDHAGCATGSCGTFRGELVDPKGKVIPTSGGNQNFSRSWL